MTTAAAVAGAPPRKALQGQLWTQVLIGMGVGILLGWWYPSLGEAMQPRPRPTGQNNSGEVLNKDDFPEAIWGSAERGATTFKTLPDLFYGYGFWVVSDRCADVMSGFNLGSGSLHPVKVFEKDKVTPIGDHGWFCLNFRE